MGLKKALAQAPSELGVAFCWAPLSIDLVPRLIDHDRMPGSGHRQGSSTWMFESTAVVHSMGNCCAVKNTGSLDKLCQNVGVLVLTEGRMHQIHGTVTRSPNPDHSMPRSVSNLSISMVELIIKNTRVCVRCTFQYDTSAFLAIPTLSTPTVSLCRVTPPQPASDGPFRAETKCNRTYQTKPVKPTGVP